MPAAGGGIYQLALTHRSYAFEQPEAEPHNERLEFLGDAILEAVVDGCTAFVERFKQMNVRPVAGPGTLSD